MNTIYKVDFNSLKSKLDELENEYSNFSNVAYKNYLDSYLKTFGGSTLITSMKDSLDSLYSNVNNGYKKIIDWLDNYYTISNNIENVLAKYLQLGSISEDNIRNYIENKLLNIESSALTFTNIPKLEKMGFNFFNNNDTYTNFSKSSSNKNYSKSDIKNKITKDSMIEHKSKNPYWLNNHLMDEYSNEKSALENKFTNFIIKNERSIKIKSNNELGFKSYYTEQELTKYVLENPEYFKNLLSSEEFKNIVGMTYEEYVEAIDTYNCQIATCKASMYATKQEQKQAQYVELMQSEDFLKFKSTISTEEAKYYCLTNLKYLGIDTLASIGYLSDDETLLLVYLYKNEGKKSVKKFIGAYEDKINQAKGKAEADKYIAEITDDKAFSNFVTAMSNGVEINSIDDVKAFINLEFNETDQEILKEINECLFNYYTDAGLSNEYLVVNNENSALAVVQTYTNLKNAYGIDIANTYVSNIEQCLNDCSLTLNISIKDGASKYFTTFGQGFGDGIESFTEGFENIFRTEGMISDNQYAQMYIASYLNGKTSLNLDYQISTSIGNMTPTVVLATLTGGTMQPVVTALNFASSFGNTYNQGLVNGNNNISSALNAVVVAGSDSVIEALAGGIEALKLKKTVGTLEDVAVKSLKGTLKDSLNSFVKGFVPNAFKEGGQEAFQSYLEAYSNKLFFGDEVDLAETSKEALYSATVGAFTASIMNSANFVSSLAQTITVHGINKEIEIGARIKFDNEIINGNIDLSQYNNVEEAFKSYITNNPDVMNFGSLKYIFNKMGNDFVSKVKQKTETAKENALNFIADNGGFVELDGFNKKSNIEKEEITSLKHEINTLANSIKNNNTANISVEQQINEANYYIEKGTLLSKTIKANSLSEITPELLLKINDPSVVNFEVDGKKYSYIDMKQELGMISKPNTNIKEIISNPNNSLAVKGENSYNYVNAEIKTVFNENVNFGKSFLGLLLTPLTLITRFKNDSVLTNPDICNKIVNEGIYHFTSEQTAHKILESGYVKESNPMISYGNKKSFFFAGIPDFQDLVLNLNKLETKRVAVKIKVDENGLSDFNYRSMTDNALSHNGNYNFDSSKAEIVYLGLFEENGKLVYKEMPKTNWDSYKCDINYNKINNAYGNIGSYLIALGKEVEVFTNSMNKIKNNILNVTSKIKVNDNFKALANKPLKLYSDLFDRKRSKNPNSQLIEKMLEINLDKYTRLLEITKTDDYKKFMKYNAECLSNGIDLKQKSNVNEIDPNDYLSILENLSNLKKRITAENNRLKGINKYDIPIEKIGNKEADGYLLYRKRSLENDSYIPKEVGDTLKTMFNDDSYIYGIHRTNDLVSKKIYNEGLKMTGQSSQGADGSIYNLSDNITLFDGVNSKNMQVQFLNFLQTITDSSAWRPNGNNEGNVLIIRIPKGDINNYNKIIENDILKSEYIIADIKADNFRNIVDYEFKNTLQDVDTNGVSKTIGINNINETNKSSISSKQVSEKNVNLNNKIGFSFFNKKTNNYNYDSMIDNIIQIMDSKYGTGIGIKQLQNYLETNNLNNITRTDGARDMIQKIPIEHIQKYLSNLNKVDKNIELNNFFEIHKVENYGVDQAAIENLCIYELNGQQFDYRTAKKIVNDAKNNMQVIPHFKKIGNNQYSYLKSKLNNMGFSNSEASIIMSSINDAGACSYASVCNNIYYLFRNSEAYFESVFGYKMYKPNGEFNSEELLLDLYVFANLENNGGHFLKQNPFNGKCYINQQYLGDTIDVFGRQIFKSDMQEYMSDSLNGRNNEIIDKFLKSKDSKLSYESKFLFDNFSAKTYSKNNRQSIISNLIDLLNSGEYALDMNYYSNGNEITAISYDRNSYADQSTLNWNEGGGHSVAITGVADSGFVVSSWGNKYFIPYDNLFNGGSFQVGVSSIKYKR